MLELLFIPVAMQGVLMSVDEFYCHHSRGLNRWERWGHPVDTAFFLLPLVLSLVMAWTIQNLWIYVFASFLSCLIVTKDEWVHASECEPFEQWLHAMLFVIHPIVLGVFGLLWFAEFDKDFLTSLCSSSLGFVGDCTPESLRNLRGLFVMTGGFFAAYQLVYWSRWAHPRNGKRKEV